MSQTHSSRDALPWDILEKYYAGDASPEEREQVAAYFARHRATAAVTEQLARTVRAQETLISPVQRATQVEAMLSAAHERMQPRAELKRMVHTWFGGSIEQAVAALLDLADTELTEEEVEHLRVRIQQAKQEGR